MTTNDESTERRALPDDINPGIVKLVTLLNAAGLETTDSGDGETHGYSCDRECAYVVVRCQPAALVATADTVRALLRTYGVDVRPFDPELPTPTVQASYDPSDGIAIVDISNVHDRMLREPIE